MKHAIMASVLSVVLMAPAWAQSDETDQDHHERGRGGVEMWRHMRGMGAMIGPVARAFANGTFFRVKIGDNEIDIHCPASTPLQGCVSSAIELMKGMQAAETGNGQP